MRIFPIKSRFKNENLTEINTIQHYYYQIQLHLRTTQRTYAIFGVYTLVNLHYLKILKNNEFFERHMLPKLKAFWEDGLLEELINKNNLVVKNKRYTAH